MEIVNRKKEYGKMKFEELLTKVRTMAQKADVSNQDFLAVQVNIEGKESGVFYV